MKRPVPPLLACALLLLAGCDALSSPQRRTCGRVGKLCELSGEKISTCEDEVGRVMKEIGKEQAERLAACVRDSKGCAEANGCLAGAGLGALGEQIHDFLRGMGRSLK